VRQETGSFFNSRFKFFTKKTWTSKLCF